MLADPAGVLTDILTLHVVCRPAAVDDRPRRRRHRRHLGGTLTIDQFGDRVTVDAGSGPAIVVCGDIQTANATVHIIDSVLLPAGSTGQTAEIDSKLRPSRLHRPRAGRRLCRAEIRVLLEHVPPA